METGTNKQALGQTDRNKNIGTGTEKERHRQGRVTEIETEIGQEK